jgi:hypothetical protein
MNGLGDHRYAKPPKFNAGGEGTRQESPSKAELFKLDPEDVLTSEQSGKLLAPFTKPAALV